VEAGAGPAPVRHDLISVSAGTETPPPNGDAPDDDWPQPARTFPALDTPMDLDRIAAAVLEILEAIGEDPTRDGLRDTPQRVARMYAEICAGLHESADAHLKVTFDADHDEMVMVRDIALHSLCEHHLVPFLGKAHIAYIPGPDGRITGLSKLARLVDAYARRPQVQEKLTSQIADEIDRMLTPQGVMVVIEAEHLCMTMRGIRKAGATTVTSAVRGLFRRSVATREEAMRFIIGRA
jgi:GTP cyclohydrolase I